ncbi:hypothetical protein GIB67_037798 [Kingdonia uniflora]|uniref:Bifunctional inhibitor/plant lipid transfer protein/seed storage helical domain-containing protein n=1 Tax=Kingdonia uniflora TaxID=39325 RepID=A0A7J7LVB8_9MAGN|nr:hypothetical protein GIB67_037798 [Kingdonia uniflora]
MGIKSGIAATTTSVAMVFMLLAYSSVSAQEAPAPAPEAGLDCMTPLVNMSDCLTFVEAGSKLKTPDKGCCPAFAGLVESAPICLCQLLGNSNSFGITLDMNKALSLPTVCKVQTPPVSLCPAGVPAGSPMASESPSPSLAPEGTSIPKSFSTIVGGSPLLLVLGLFSSVVVAEFIF